MKTTNRNKKFKARPLLKWHRNIGLAIAPFILLMLITAFFLNHSDELGLSIQHVESKPLLAWYGVKEPESIWGFRLEEKWLYQSGNKLFYGNLKTDHKVEKLSGALLLDEIIYIIDEGSLLLMTLNGQLIEKLGQAHGLPSGAKRIASIDDRYIVIKGTKGTFQSDLDLLDWTTVSHDELKWSIPQALPEAINKSALKEYRGKGPTYERLLLDLHSGRFMGKWGTFIMDAFAALFLILSLFGIWTWSAGKKRKQN